MPDGNAFIITGDDFGYDSAANRGIINGLDAVLGAGLVAGRRSLGYDE